MADLSYFHAEEQYDRPSRRLRTSEQDLVSAAHALVRDPVNQFPLVISHTLANEPILPSQKAMKNPGALAPGLVVEVN
jgi:hypothetical protein